MNGYRALGVAALAAWAGCGFDDAGRGAAADARPATPDAPSCAAAPLSVELIDTEKRCQLTGDWDAQRNQPTLNRTTERYGMLGTDLGVSFEHDGRLWILFGDTIPSDPNAAWDYDAIAHSDETALGECLALDVLTGPDGTFKRTTVPGVDLFAFHVPLDGISAGDSMYVWFSTGAPGSYTMDRSVLARSDDDAQSFTLVRDVSDHRFINVSAELVAADEWPGLPGGGGSQVLSFGSGRYRGSDIYLAASPLATLEDAAATRYFAGTEPGGCTPRWSTQESEAVAVIDTIATDAAAEGCVGELSVHHDEVLGMWIALYNCAEPRGIQLRVAHQPWGPWSDGITIFDPGTHGYCQFMHTPWDVNQCDAVHDPGRENDWGGEYGPYVLERFTRAGADALHLYYVMSTWNPYETVVMEATLRVP